MLRRTFLPVLVVSMATAAVPAPVLAAADQTQSPDVLAAKVRTGMGSDSFDFDVTVPSPYDTPQRYTDAFRVLSRDGTVYGERKLLHDHAGEQPFTRELYGVNIPPAVKEAVVQGRGQRHGYGGKTVTVTLPGR